MACLVYPPEKHHFANSAASGSLVGFRGLFFGGVGGVKLLESWYSQVKKQQVVAYRPPDQTGGQVNLLQNIS